MPALLILLGFVVMVVALPMFESLLIFLSGFVLIILGLIWGWWKYDWDIHPTG